MPHTGRSRTPRLTHELRRGRAPRLRVFAAALLALALVGGGAMRAEAQQAVSSATLGGRVEDADGAVIGGAVVVVTNLGTNQQLTAATDDGGRFRFSYVPVGDYRLLVECGGFSPSSMRLTLAVGQAADVRVTLSAGGLAESVEVMSSAQLVEAARTQVSGTVTPREVDALPLNGRNYLDLALLVPGVSRTNTGSVQRFAETSAVAGTGVSVNGQRNLNNSFLVDGLSSNDDAANLAGAAYSQEVVREFQVVTSGGIAEFGRASAGVVNVLTKSGANEARGRLYGFLRNQRLGPGDASAPTFPNVLPSRPLGLTTMPNVTRIDPEIENSYGLQTSLQVERELPGGATLAVGYTGLRGKHLILSRNLNAPTLTAAEARRLGVANLGRPDPLWGNVSRYESSGSSAFDGLLVSLNQRAGRWATVRASYTFSKSTDNTGNFFFSTPQDNDDLRGERGPSDNDQRHRLSLSGTLEAPPAGVGAHAARARRLPAELHLQLRLAPPVQRPDRHRPQRRHELQRPARRLRPEHGARLRLRLARPPPQPPPRALGAHRRRTHRRGLQRPQPREPATPEQRPRPRRRAAARLRARDRRRRLAPDTVRPAARLLRGCV